VELLLLHALEALPGPPQRIFISYRHGEADYAAYWLRDQLSGRYGKDQVFIDVNSIGLGSRFAGVIASKLRTCEVLLALIGNRWLTTTNAEGTRRIDDPDDFVSLEIGTALERNILVIPILIDGATMPSHSDLPDRIAQLADLNALKVSADSFDSDVERLFEELDNASSPPGTGN
jgi:TIR domain